MRHHTNELSFERPPWLRDRTHHLFAVDGTGGPAGPSPFNVVVSRSPLGDETLDEVADRILRELAAVLEDFQPGPREAAVVAGEPARMLQFQWTQNGQRLYQRQAVVARAGADGDPDARTLFQVAATASGDAQQRHVAGFDALIASVRFRGADGDGRAD